MSFSQVIGNINIKAPASVASGGVSETFCPNIPQILELSANASAESSPVVLTLSVSLSKKSGMDRHLHTLADFDVMLTCPNPFRHGSSYSCSYGYGTQSVMSKHLNVMHWNYGGLTLEKIIYLSDLQIKPDLIFLSANWFTQSHTILRSNSPKFPYSF